MADKEMKSYLMNLFLHFLIKSESLLRMSTNEISKQKARVIFSW